MKFEAAMALLGAESGATEEFFSHRHGRIRAVRLVSGGIEFHHLDDPLRQRNTWDEDPRAPQRSLGELAKHFA